MKKHTRILALLLALCMALSLAACSGNSGSSGSSSASGKTVVIGCQTDLVTLDPGNMYEPYANMISYAAYDMLYRVKPGTMGDPEPSVATGYKVDESKKVYTFTLRKDVVFASGNKLENRRLRFDGVSGQRPSNSGIFGDKIHRVDVGGGIVPVAANRVKFPVEVIHIVPMSDRKLFTKKFPLN